MALRAVPEHPKFAHLRELLKAPKCHILGYLESIWHFCGRFTPQGNIGKYSDAQIEAWVEWLGEPGGLIAALVESRWLDPDPTYRLVVHDWHIHADKASKNALTRQKLPFVRTAYVPHTNGSATSGTAYPLPAPVPVPVPGAGAGAGAEEAQQQRHETRYEPIEELDKSELARSTVGELISVHPAPGSPHMAVGALEKILANAVSPLALVASVKRNHAASVKFWEEERALNPRFFIPQLHRWFNDGDYLHPPKARGPTPSSGSKTSYLERRLKEAEAKERG